MSEKQYEVNELVEKFSTLHPGDTVRLTTDAGSMDCQVSDVSVTDEEAELRLVRKNGESDLRVHTTWVKGWLDPLVDAVATTESRHEPLGTLFELNVVSSRVRSGPSH